MIKMGLYDKKFGFNFAFDARMLRWPAIIIAVVLVIALLAIAVNSLVQQKAIELQYTNNPLDLSSAKNALLGIKITNITEQDANGVIINVKAADAESIIIYPEESDALTLAKGESRIFTVAIKPNPAKEVLSGDYAISVSAEINGEKFEAKSFLTIKTA